MPEVAKRPRPAPAGSDDSRTSTDLIRRSLNLGPNDGSSIDLILPRAASRVRRRRRSRSRPPSSSSTTTPTTPAAPTEEVESRRRRRPPPSPSASRRRPVPRRDGAGAGSSEAPRFVHANDDDGDDDGDDGGGAPHPPALLPLLDESHGNDDESTARRISFIEDDTYGTYLPIVPIILKSRKHHLCKTHSQVGRNTTSDSTHIIISSLKRARHNLDGWYGVLASCSARTITATDDRSTRRLRNLELVITGSTESCVVHMTISWAVASHAILATLLIARAGAFSSPFIPRNTPTTHQTNLFGIKGFRSWFESGIARRSLAVPSRH